MERIGNEHRVAYVTFHVVTPEPGEDLRLPVKAKVWCDDMPDGTEDWVEQVECVIRRKATGPVAKAG